MIEDVIIYFSYYKVYLQMISNFLCDVISPVALTFLMMLQEP